MEYSDEGMSDSDELYIPPLVKSTAGLKEPLAPDLHPLFVKALDEAIVAKPIMRILAGRNCEDYWEFKFQLNVPVYNGTQPVSAQDPRLEQRVRQLLTHLHRLPGLRAVFLKPYSIKLRMNRLNRLVNIINPAFIALAVYGDWFGKTIQIPDQDDGGTESAQEIRLAISTLRTIYRSMENCDCVFIELTTREALDTNDPHDRQP